MEDMGQKFSPVIASHILSPLSMFGPMAGTSWTHSYSLNSTNRGFSPLPATPFPTTHPTPYNMPFWKTNQVVTLGLFHFTGPANAYKHTLSIHSCTMLYAIDYLALLKV